MTATYRPTPQVPALDGMTPLGVSPQKTLEERVLEWTETLCESLAENYKRYHRRMIERNSAYFNGDGKRQDLSDYAQKQIDEMDNGTWKGMKFRIENGRKYYRIIQQDYDTFQDRNEYRDGSVHAFVDKTTGDVYKPAGWAKPAQHVRYNLLDDKSRQDCLSRCDWAGGYLYMR